MWCSQTPLFIHQREVMRSIEPVIGECTKKIHRADARLKEDGHSEDKRIVDVTTMIESEDSATADAKVKAKQGEIDELIAGGGTTMQALPLKEELEEYVQARAMAQAATMLEKGFGKEETKPEDVVITPEVFDIYIPCF